MNSRPNGERAPPLSGAVFRAFVENPRGAGTDAIVAEVAPKPWGVFPVHSSAEHVAVKAPTSLLHSDHRQQSPRRSVIRAERLQMPFLDEFLWNLLQEPRRLLHHVAGEAGGDADERIAQIKLVARAGN